MPAAAQAQGRAAAATASAGEAIMGNGASGAVGPAGQPVVSAPSASAIAALLDQAEFWQQQSRPDRALSAIERILVVDPNNVEALARGAELATLANRPEQSREYLRQIRRIAPADPRIARTEDISRLLQDDGPNLAAARQLAQSGRPAEAVQRYRQLFRDSRVPAFIANEYFQTLAASSEAGYREAVSSLARLTEADPGNTALALTYAQLLTYREETRSDGIDRLIELFRLPAARESARQPWRQALLWLGDDADTAARIDQYLESNPTDPEIAAKRRGADRQPDPGLELRMQAWREMELRRFAESERRFRAALEHDQNDAESLTGLAIIRKIQNRFAEARQFLEQAVAIYPDRREEFERSVGDLSGRTTAGYTVRPGAGGQGQGRRGTGSAGASAPVQTPDLQQARNLIDAGNPSEAVPVLNRIVARSGGDRPDAEALLGDIALRQGNAQQAEAHYRAALSRRGNFGAALSGLASAMQAQGRFGEAEEIYRRLGQVPQPGVRAEALRAEAGRTEDPGAAAALLRAAIQAEPNNPWVKLDLARLMARNGQGAQARALMEETAGGTASRDAMFAAAIFANEQSRHADAVRLIERVPAGSRNADMNRLLAGARVQAEVASAAALASAGRRPEARQRLVAIASRPDPTGEAAPAAVRALNAINDPVGAQQAARAAALANRGQTPENRLAVAGALMEAGLDRDAAQVAGSLDPARLTAEQRRNAGQIQAGLSIRAADQLNGAGNHAAAWEALAPTLRQDPQNVDANLALSRLYQSAREPEQAQRVAEAVLSRNPRNTDARQAAMDAAIANRDWRRAEALVAEGRALLPGDARIPLLEARLARAWGDQRRARNALEEAARLRRDQIGATSDPATMGLLAPQATVPQQQPAASYDNPFRRVPLSGDPRSVSGFSEVAQAPPGRVAAGQPMQGQQYAQAMMGNPPVVTTPSDPLLNEINRQLQEVRQEAAPVLTPSFGLRTRSGDPGIDRMVESSAGGEGSIAMPGIGGRLTARAAAINIDNGNMSTDYQRLRRVGTLPISAANAGGASASPQVLQGFANGVETSATGVALGAAYTRPDFTLDVGTTPLGFNQTSIVGGIEVAPEIGDGVRLRLALERRAMTDSLLAWGGVRDPGTGRQWGGVVRTGGRGQLEFQSGETAFYVGGGYYQITGEGVVDNSRYEFNAGFSTPVWRGTTDEVTSGVDLVYIAYDQNLRYFTLGHGGYFSPQSFMAVTVPVDYRGRSGNLAYRLGASVGYSTFSEDRAPLFPNDPGLQAQMAGIAAGDPTASAFYASQSKSGISGGLRGDIEYLITPQLRIGGALRFDRSADWNETRGLLYARYRFDR
jgi:tetratricopeptide (TPR) repeat protein